MRRPKNVVGKRASVLPLLFSGRRPPAGIDFGTYDFFVDHDRRSIFDSLALSMFDVRHTPDAEVGSRIRSLGKRNQLVDLLAFDEISV